MEKCFKTQNEDFYGSIQKLIVLDWGCFIISKVLVISFFLFFFLAIYLFFFLMEKIGKFEIIEKLDKYEINQNYSKKNPKQICIFILSKKIISIYS